VAVAVFILVFEDGEVGLVAAFGDFVIFQGFENGAAGLVCVCAVAETAVLTKTEYLTEIMRDFGALKIEGAKATDAGSVDDVGPSPRSPYFEHLGEGGGVEALVVGFAEGGGLGACLRDKTIQEGALADAAVAAEKGGLTLKERKHFLYSLASFGRDGETGVVEIAVEIHHGIEIAALVLVIKVYLIENDGDGDAVCLGGSEETVYEGCGCLGVGYGHNEAGEVNVCGNDMALLGEVRGATDDIIAAVVDFGDKRPTPFPSRGGRGDFHPVTDGDGVGAADAAQTEVALHLTGKKLAVVRSDVVPASCVLDD